MSIPPYHERADIIRNELPAALPDEANQADLSLEQIKHDYQFLRALAAGRLIHIDPATHKAIQAPHHYARSLPALSTLLGGEETGQHSALRASYLDPEQAGQYIPLYKNLIEYMMDYAVD